MADKAYDPFANENSADITATTSDADDPASALLSGDAGTPPNPSREHALANSFDDPSSLFTIAEETSQPLVQETAAAVHELITEPMQQPGDWNAFQENATPMSNELSVESPPSFESPALPNVGDPFATLQAANEASATVWSAKAQMAEKLFALVLSDYKFDLLVEKILEVIMEATDAQAGSVLEFDAAGKEFFFRATLGGGDTSQVKAFRIPAYKGIVGHVAESKNILLLNDLDDNKMQLKSVSMATNFETKSCLAAPFMIANQLYGVVELFNRRGINYFDNNDKILVEDGLKMAAKILEVRFFSAMLWGKQQTRKTAA